MESRLFCHHFFIFPKISTKVFFNEWKKKCNTLSVFATDCNAVESSVTTGRDQTEHGDDSVTNFIFNIILAKACYGFWRLFCCGFIYFFVVNVACSSSATPLRSSTDSKTNSWSVHTALLFRICFLAIRARFIWLSLTSRSPPPAQPPTPPSPINQPSPPPLSFLPHAGELLCILTCARGTSGSGRISRLSSLSGPHFLVSLPSSQTGSGKICITRKQSLGNPLRGCGCLFRSRRSGDTFWLLPSAVP